MQNQPDRQIIVAEDDPSSRALLTRHLQKAGYEVSAHENGKQALERIRRENSCIVVADWMMPEMDGLELCRTVRSLCEFSAISFVYFILLTAHSEKDQIVAGLEAGADDYLTKPYHREELLARLRAGERVLTLQEELVARQITVRKANSELTRLNHALEKLANTDSLTELANRRHLFERFREMWALAERGDTALACIMFDIDKFKSINDTYGHSSGDEVLKGVAGTARDCLRRYDLLGRFGGEEFCVVCPQTDIAGSAALAERIRERIAGLRVVSEGRPIPVTVSLGVAVRSNDQESPDDLISRADAMLYKAKEGGRNQVWVEDPTRGEMRFQPEPVGHGT